MGEMKKTQNNFTLLTFMFYLIKGIYYNLVGIFVIGVYSMGGVAVSLLLPFELGDTSIVKDDPEEGAGIRSEFSHLLLEITIIVSWETLNSFGNRCEFTHEHEHVL